MMQDAVVGIGLDRADVGVVVGVLHPDPRRRVRLGHPDGDDERPAAIDAVGRLDLEAIAVGRLDTRRVAVQRQP